MRSAILTAVILLHGMSAGGYGQQGPSIGRHWGYEYPLGGHIQGHHGVSVAGLSHEQMLELHDAIHEGRSHSCQIPVRSVPMQSAFVSRRTFRRARWGLN